MRNPFIVSGKIPKEYFCDRENESSQLIRLLTNGNNVVLVSPRRMGKTGLIYHCFSFPEIRENYNTIFVDILQSTCLQEFTFLFGKAVYESLVPKGKRLITKFLDSLKSLSGKFTFDATTGAPSFSIQLGDIVSPTYTLDEIFDFIERYPEPCLVAFDEFQQITSYPERNVEAILRTHIQRLGNCKFIFSGSRQHLISEMFINSSRPFYHSASWLYLSPIPEEVYSDFVERLFKESDRRIHRDDIVELYRRFEGVTFYLQSIFNAAFSMTTRKETCTSKIIENALREVVESRSGIYRELLSGLTIRQKELLIAISKAEPATGITASAFISKYGLLSASSVQSAAKKLTELNLIVKSEGKYYNADKFLSIWLKQSY